MKLFELLSARERRNFFLLLGMIMFSGLLDMIGVASVLPFLTVLSDPDSVANNHFLAVAFRRLSFESVDRFLVFLGVLTFALIIVSQAFKALTIYALTRFSRMREFSISSRVFARYLNQPYTWHLNQHSADLGKSVLSEVEMVIQGILVPALRVLAHGAIVLFLVGLLLYVEPLGAIGIAIMIGGSYAAIFLATRTRLARIGGARLRANAARYRLAQEALAVVKEVKLLGLEDKYVQRFDVPAADFARWQTTSSIIAEIPRYLLEGLVFGGMILLLLGLMATSDGQLADVLPTAGVFAVAGARLFPALQQIYGGASTLGFFRPALDAIHGDLIGTAPHQKSSPNESGSAPLVLRDRIELRGVTYSYPGAERAALCDLNLTIQAKTTVGLVGATGAGKTTVVDIILGLLEPQSGVLAVDGIIIHASNRASWQSSLGYVPQEIVLTDDSVAANIAFGIPPSAIDMGAVVRAAQIAELHEFVATELPSGYESKIGERGVRLSGGQRQRIGIARALYRDPEVLVLDEATSALDGLTERAVMDAVRNLGRKKTIIMIAHRLSTVRECSEIFYLENGRCSAVGSYADLIDRHAGFRQLSLSNE